jgi:hypothetical protein
MAFTTVYHCSVSFLCFMLLVDWFLQFLPAVLVGLTGASMFGLFPFHMTWWINIFVTVLDVVTFPLQPYTLVSPSLVIFLTSFHHCVLLVKNRWTYVQHRCHVAGCAAWPTGCCAWCCDIPAEMTHHPCLPLYVLVTCFSDSVLFWNTSLLPFLRLFLESFLPWSLIGLLTELCLSSSPCSLPCLSRVVYFSTLKMIEVSLQNQYISTRLRIFTSK